MSPFHPIRALATWFGAGDLPTAPGTWGSLAALPFAWFILHQGGGAGLLAATGLIALIGVKVSADYARTLGHGDPGPVVIDEVAGQWLTLAPLGFVTGPLFGNELWGFAIAFVLFRFFDILKPWPASWIDSQLAGGLGIMGDDLIAGLYGALCLSVLLFLFPGA